MNMFILDLNTGSIEFRSREADGDYPDQVLDSEWNPELDKLVPLETPALQEVEHEDETPAEWILGVLAQDQ